MFRATHKLRYDRGVTIKVMIRGDHAINYRGDRFPIGDGSALEPLPRKPLKTLKPGGRLAQAGRKLAARRKLYAVQSRSFLARPENQWCPVAAAGVMPFEKRRQRTTQIHHKDGREGDLLLDESLWLAVSMSGHEWIHQHPNAARERGWLV